jgi:vacuolar-type H+-ATPase subunit C/Vma6
MLLQHLLNIYPCCSIATLAVAQNMRELYRLVLVDTPLAPYFSECITSEDLDEMNIEVMRNTLYKAYLEDFYRFCKKLGGATSTIMCDLLAFEADRRAINITINRQAVVNIFSSRPEHSFLITFFPDWLHQLTILGFICLRFQVGPFYFQVVTLGLYFCGSGCTALVQN